MTQTPHDLPALATLSARIGADPLLIQGAGGNTSVKDGAVMWIKASGTLLADALIRPVFVPCDLPGMRASVAAGEARADQPAEFALAKDGLRPSIETSLHAVFAQRIVVHVHCVNTLALAIRTDARAQLAARLQGFDWGFVDYAKPGAHLADGVRRVLGPQTDVVVLGNHGLIVAADTVADADALLGRVVAALRTPAAAITAASPLLAARQGEGYISAPPDHPLHGVARNPARLSMALGGSLYPDHVIFCGPAADSLLPGETPGQVAAKRRAQGLADPVFLLVPGVGALIRSDANAGALALAQCLGEVLARVPETATLTYLSFAQNAELLNWDAEKYRQTLNAG